MQKEVVQLLNLFSTTRLDDLINSFDKEDIISRYQNKNTISLPFPIIGRNRVISHIKLEEQIEDTKKDISNVNFFY